MQNITRNAENTTSDLFSTFRQSEKLLFTHKVPTINPFL